MNIHISYNTCFKIIFTMNSLFKIFWCCNPAKRRAKITYRYNGNWILANITERLKQALKTQITSPSSLKFSWRQYILPWMSWTIFKKCLVPYENKYVQSENGKIRDIYGNRHIKKAMIKVHIVKGQDESSRQKRNAIFYLRLNLILYLCLLI